MQPVKISFSSLFSISNIFFGNFDFSDFLGIKSEISHWRVCREILYHRMLLRHRHRTSHDLDLKRDGLEVTLLTSNKVC